MRLVAGLRHHWLPQALVVVGLSALAAVTVPDHLTTVAVAVLIVCLGPLMLKASPQVWMGAALVLPWTSRLLTTHGAPRALDFFDFPLVAVAVVVAGLDHIERRGRLPSGHRRIVQWLVVVALVMAASGAVNDHREPLRLVGALLIELEPFLLIVAYLLSPPTPRHRKWLLGVIAVIAAVDSLVAVGQKLTVGRTNTDFVKGLLFGEGAGHHVQAGAVAFVFFAVVQGYRRLPLSVAFGAAALVITSMADNKQVQYVLPLALLVFVFAPKPSGRSNRRVVVALALIMAVTLGVAIKTSHVTKSAAIYVRVSNARHAGKPAVIRAMWHDLSTDPASIPLGFGPGESVSRFAFLTTPQLLKGGSPVTALHLHPALRAEHYQALALAGLTNSVGISSFTQAQSSVLGILGDYGLLGALAYTGLIASLLRALWRQGRVSHLASAALAGWAMVLPLAAVFDWLEQPPFTLILATITGLALTEVVKARHAPTGVRAILPVQIAGQRALPASAVRPGRAPAVGALSGSAYKAVTEP